MKYLLFLLTIFSITSSTASGIVYCNERLETLLGELAKARESKNPEIAAAAKSVNPPLKYFTIPPQKGFIAAVKKGIHKGRDVVRHSLMVWQEHPYAMTQIEIAPAAARWAKEAFEPSKAEEDAPETSAASKFNAGLINEKLKETLTHLENYNLEIETLLDRALQNELKINGLRKASANGRDFAIELYYPTWERKKGKIVIGREKEYFGSRTQIDIEIRKSKRTRKELKQAIKQRAFDQAFMAKKIEIFRHELLRQMEVYEGKPLPKPYAEFLARADKIYVNGKAEDLHPNMRPPRWAWETLKWAQLGSELVSVFKQKSAVLKDRVGDETFKSMVEWIDGLSPREREKLGVDKIKDIGDKWKERWKPARSAGTITTIMGSLLAGGIAWGPSTAQTIWEESKDLYEWFQKDETRRIECVSKEDEEDYLDCAFEYLTDKFPDTFKANRGELRTIFGEESELSGTPEGVEVARLRDMRNEFVHEKILQDELSDQTKAYLSRNSLNSGAWRKLMIHGDNKTFREMLLSEDPMRGHLAFRFPTAWKVPKVRELTALVCDTKTPEERKKAIATLARLPAAAKLAEEVTSVFEDREEALREEIADEVANVFKPPLEDRRNDAGKRPAKPTTQDDGPPPPPLVDEDPKL